MAKKATVKINGIPDVQKNLLKFINDTVKDKDFLDEIGQETADQIRNRTRGRLEEYKQDPLTSSTIDQRKKLIAAGNFTNDRATRPAQSNLTLSGQLLDAISSRVNQTNAVITIFLQSQRQPYKGLRGKNLQTPTNIEIKDDLEQAYNRKFLFISAKLHALLESKIAQNLRRKLSIYNQIRRKLKL